MAMKIAIGITHYPRKVETLQASLVTMPTGTTVTIYPDGNHHVRPYVDVEVLGEHAGCFRHWHRVLEHLCAKNVDAVGIMPDDVQYHPKTWRLITNKLRDERTGYVAAFLPKGMAERYQWGKGWHTCNNGWASSWGGGYVFPIAVARKLLQHPFIIDHMDNYAANKQIDHAIPEAVFQMGLNQWYHYPSLLRHIGFTSTIGHEHTEAENAAGW